ncbi:serine/threonine-protein kinase [Paratractidigestivibacter sp.]|uniref:serine/threonine protein kinase n=1 Tax=Paratractidigestivibacter sp. TaxID=2847316 RepID=UPI002AC8AA98|nr:serine/threonine-protein kinase [Paratractidigestivibacter sp.]
MNDEQIMHAMSLDDVYHVDRMLAHGAGGLTELVSIDGAGPFVRKKLPLEIANQSVWSTIGAIDCKRLPKVEASYLLPDQYVVVYDYVPGQTLEDLISGCGRLDAAEAASLVGDICEAAAALHSCGIIHRDLSPRNVIVAADGAHLIDLGIARVRVEGANRDTTSLGTRGFASPEQYGFAQTDARSDVYAIGKLFGYMLTGMQPDGEAYEAELSDPAAVDPRLAAVVRRACAFEPSARYQSAVALAEAIHVFEDEILGKRDGGAVPAAAPAQGASDASPDGKKHIFPLMAKVLFAIGAAALIAAIVLAVRLALGGGSGDAVSSDAGGGSIATGAADATTSGSTGDASGLADATAQKIVQDSAAYGISQGFKTVAESGGAGMSDEDFTLELAESGWSAGDGGYVHFAFGVRNTSENTAITLANVEITGYDADGNLLFSQDAGFMIALPNQVSYFAGQAGGGPAPARVEFKLQRISTTSARHMDGDLQMKVDSLSVNKGSYFTTFVGTYSVTGDEAGLASIPSYLSTTGITLVLRDEAGNIVYGTNTYDYDLSLGEDKTFQINASDLPAYATVEAYAHPR